MTFREWFDTFCEEKGINDVYKVWDLQSPNGTWNHIDIEVVIEYVQNITDPAIQKTIKDNFVKIDFFNGDVYHFFKHMAQGIVNAHGDM